MKGIDLFRLDGRAAVVTGGSKGLGYSIAQGLTSAGADVALCSRNRDEAEEAARRLREESGRKVLAVACDVAREDQVRDLVDAALRGLGKIDILVNNAGINIRGPIEDLQPAQFDSVMATNVRGPWLLCREAGPHLKKARYGRVINMSSTLGSVGVPGRTPYASSKGAVTMLTKVLALEWADFGITVNAICPGPFLTPMNQSIALKPETQRFIIGAVALGRWGELHEIQGAAIFLASDASSYITGTTLFVDGGWTAH